MNLNHSPSRWLVPLLTVTLAVLVASTAFLTPVAPVAALQDQESTFEIEVVDFAFEPAELTVPVGATVTWTNTGERPHTVTADDLSLIHISEPTRRTPISYAVFCLKKKK